MSIKHFKSELVGKEVDIEFNSHNVIPNFNDDKLIFDLLRKFYIIYGCFVIPEFYLYELRVSAYIFLTEYCKKENKSISDYEPYLLLHKEEYYFAVKEKEDIILLDKINTEAFTKKSSLADAIDSTKKNPDCFGFLVLAFLTDGDEGEIFNIFPIFPDSFNLLKTQFPKECDRVEIYLESFNNNSKARLPF